MIGTVSVRATRVLPKFPWVGLIALRCLARLAALEQRLETELQNCGNTATMLRVDVEDSSPKPHPMLTEKPPQGAKGDTDDFEVDGPAEDAMDSAMDPVAFLETTWNLVLVAGHASVGWIDLAIAWLLLIASAGMQITFSVILLSPSFLGEPFDEAQVEVARKWRNSVAHDSKYMDLARTSLTARVCNNDGGLILSNAQAGLRGTHPCTRSFPLEVCLGQFVLSCGPAASGGLG